MCDVCVDPLNRCKACVGLFCCFLLCFDRACRDVGKSGTDRDTFLHLWYRHGTPSLRTCLSWEDNGDVETLLPFSLKLLTVASHSSMKEWRIHAIQALDALVCNLFNLFKRRQLYRTVERCCQSSVGGGWAVLVSENYFGCNTSRPSQCLG